MHVASKWMHVAEWISVKFLLLLSEPYLTQAALNFHELILSAIDNNKTDFYAIQGTFFQCEFLASFVLKHIR